MIKTGYKITTKISHMQVFEQNIFREVAGVWQRIGVDSRDSVMLCDFLRYLEIEIGEQITYCLAENEKYYVKYKIYGARIYVYVREKTTK